MSFASEAEGERDVTALRAQLERQREEGAPEGSLYWTSGRLERAERMLKALRGGPPLPARTGGAVRAPLRRHRLVTAPGESLRNGHGR